MGWSLQIICVFFCFAVTHGHRYTSNWTDLDSRPLPEWYDKAKIGIFMHWGVFSVPSYCVNCASEWFWTDWHGGNADLVNYMKANYPPSFTYQDFGPMFKAEFFDANKWADVLQDSGAKYYVLTSKHHEGFTNWPSKHSWNWNSMDIGPKRDLVGELAAAVKDRTNLRFGLYHSLFEWFHPLYLQDKANKWKTQEFVQSKTMPELYEIINTYMPELIWSDGDWEAPYTYWNSTEFIAWLFNDSPVSDTVVVNDRWGVGTTCQHGSYYTCQDRYNPKKLQNHKWENAMTLDSASWGYRRNAPLSAYLTMDNLVQTLAETVSCGGNLLINVGPSSDGMIPTIYEERLLQMGSWLKVNGEAIYASNPWTSQNDTVTPGIWYTSKSTMEDGFVVYAIALDWPKNQNLTLGSVLPTSKTTVTLLGYAGKLSWSQGSVIKNLQISIPNIPENQMPCKWAWVFKISGLSAAQKKSYNQYGILKDHHYAKH